MKKIMKKKTLIKKMGIKFNFPNMKINENIIKENKDDEEDKKEKENNSIKINFNNKDEFNIINENERNSMEEKDKNY